MAGAAPDTATLLRSYADVLERNEFRATPSMRAETLALVRRAADELDRTAEVRAGVCPFDLPDDPRADVDEDEPCPVCGMLGTRDAEDKCIAGPRSGGGPRRTIG